MKDCNQCGKCCIRYGAADLAVTRQEIEHWEESHPEIFQYVRDDKIWFDPESGEALQRCPFLEQVVKTNPDAPQKYTCSIYLVRPDDCRQYPSLITEMIRDECEMIEARDIRNPATAQTATANVQQLVCQRTV